VVGGWLVVLSVYGRTLLHYTDGSNGLRGRVAWALCYSDLVCDAWAVSVGMWNFCVDSHMAGLMHGCFTVVGECVGGLLLRMRELCCLLMRVV
jgi:hypothetical protein